MSTADKITLGDSRIHETANLSRVYQNVPITLRFLTSLGWGGELLNLGYFRYAGPLKLLNLIPDKTRLAQAQQNLVAKSVKLLNLEKNDVVLDVACGRGYATNYMASNFPEAKVVGMDLLSENIAECNRRFGAKSSAQFAVGDACQMPLPSDEFSKLLCLEAAFHFPDRQAFLRESRRVLRKNGRMVLVDFMWKSADRQQIQNNPLAGIVKKTWAWEDFSSVTEYLEMFANCGFELEARFDWTKNVTAALQWQFNVVAGLSKTRLGRNLLVKTNPSLGEFKPSEWKEIETAAKAHDFVNRHSNYIALVVKKK